MSIPLSLLTLNLLLDPLAVNGEFKSNSTLTAHP